MDWFDDIQVEELSHFDFVEEMNECFLDEDENDKDFFKNYLNSNCDY